MPFYKETFKNIPLEKQNRIMDIARAEFAKNGFLATNINAVAKKAGISIGSLYSYFSSKEDLFLALVEECYDVLEGVLEEAYAQEDHFYACVKLLLEKAAYYPEVYPYCNQIYLDITTESMAHLSIRLSQRLETITATFYNRLIEKGKEQGVVEESLSTPFVAYYLDNLIMMYQFSFTSSYYKRRMEILLGSALAEDKEEVISKLMTIIKKSLS